MIDKSTHQRIVCHFSCGAASAIATKMALRRYGKDRCEIVNIRIAEEHPDNHRFLKDCEKWFGKKITILQNEKCNGSIHEVFRQSNFIKSPQGAACTTQLKRKVRAAFCKPDDKHIFGFTIEEQERANSFNERNPNMDIDWILIENGLTKADCLGVLERAGIEIPMMYKLGYKNNNCIGCVKGGIGYWNKIRLDFPDAFKAMAERERAIGHSVLKDKNGSIWLDELDPKRGKIQDEPDIECSFFCQAIEI